jgi:hypothetical protein
MSNSSEATQLLRNRSVKCPRCGYESRMQGAYCPRCGECLTDSVLPAAIDGIDPTAAPEQSQGHLDPHARAVLQCVPSGECVSVALETPIVLGRKGPPGSEETLDLTEFNAYQQGVSRRHCQLQREGPQLTVIDLGSANGTFLNGKWLPPFQKYVVIHGDHLLLGQLQLAIYFTATESE